MSIFVAFCFFNLAGFRFLTHLSDWAIYTDVWRPMALKIRVEFDVRTRVVAFFY